MQVGPQQNNPASNSPKVVGDLNVPVSDVLARRASLDGLSSHPSSVEITRGRHEEDKYSSLEERTSGGQEGSEDLDGIANVGTEDLQRAMVLTDSSG